MGCNVKKYAPLLPVSQFRQWLRHAVHLISSFILLWLTTNHIALAEKNLADYQLGNGYKLGETGFKLGGYASLDLQGFGDQPWSLNVGDLSLFVIWDNGANLRFFSEIEGEDTLRIGSHQDLTISHSNFRLERLYLDYLVTDTLTVRIGKLLTPIGQWNVIHANPLVWTTTRPIATEHLFSEHATGIMLHGSVPVGRQSLDYAVYADYSATLDPRSTESPFFDNALGLRLLYNLNDNFKIGLSYADFALQNSTNTRNHLLGLDFAWSYKRFALNSEIVYRNQSVNFNNNAWQGYIQGVSPLFTSIYAVCRYEFFDQANQPTGQVGVFGLAYRPKPPLIWKLEYRLGEHNRALASDGLFASFSVLF